MKVAYAFTKDDAVSDQPQQDTSWKVRKASIRILKNLLHLVEDQAIAVEITQGVFSKLLPLIKHVDPYVNEDLNEYLLDVNST